jgi:hypothetical protein
MEILTYLAKVSAFWIALYACYWLLLRQHTFFRWNRFFLVASLLLSVCAATSYLPGGCA